jgi:hypothetical protein
MKWMRQATLRRFLQGGALAALLSVFTLSDAATLQAVANNSFVSATATGTSFLTATAPTASAWEQFEVVNNANGTISLKAIVSGNFVAADTGLAAPNTNKLIANRTSIGGWEQFTPVPQANGTVALRANANNLYVSADLNMGGALVANRTAVGAWEQFVIANPPTGPGPAPDLGPNVHIVSPTTPNLQGLINDIYSAQQGNHFGDRRDAILLTPGTYNNFRIPVGFYTQVLGLGSHPDQVHVNGDLRSDAYLGGDNATQNFWRGAENFSVTPSLGIGNNTMQWAVSQAIPFRRMHVRGNIKLNQNNGWSSGGWFSEVLVDGQVNSASQQQWISRNSQWGSWTGSGWNMVFVGVPNAPAGNFPTQGQRYTKVTETPVVREKPYLFIDANGGYAVRVPSLRTNSSGITWSNGATTPGTTLPIGQFFIARPADSAAAINAQLAAGKHILFTPGIYVLTQTLQVNNPNTVVLGIGFPTLRLDNGQPIMKTADVDGLTISGLFFDAGATESGVLMEVGPNGASANHAANPTVLHDVFFRVGGAAAGRAAFGLSINANNTIVDHTWLWRADHGAGVGWTSNPSAYGLWVNGNNVTIYGLFVEHFQNYQVMWNGNGGRVYFYQSEIPYDPPNQASWNSATGRGYASYKVADGVTSHEAWGLGVYSVFTNPNIFLDRAVEAPVNSNVRFHSIISVCLGSNGGIINPINNTGGQTACNAAFTPTVTNFP